MLDVPVDVVDMASALAFVDACVGSEETGGYIVAVNPEKMFALKRNPELKAFCEGASLLIPDGIGVVTAGHLLYGAKMRRVAGADLMQEICARSAERGHRIYMYGGKEDVSAAAVGELRRRYPGIHIVGRANGYVQSADVSELIKDINDSGADIVFVALGSPRQEMWIRDHKAELNVKLCQGIGGTLDTIVGTVKRAPALFRQMGLEWLYRLLKEPSRARRQMVLPLFALQVLLALLTRPWRKEWE